MTTLDGSWSPQIRKISELERGDHWYLGANDECFFFGEYTARGGYNHSSTNQIITNIKKKPSLKATGQWRHKLHDMKRIASAIAGSINPQSFGQVTLVPVPPSKLPSHPEYDARMFQIAKWVSPNADVRELICLVKERDAAHESEHRLKPNELMSLLELNLQFVNPKPQQIILIDDVITTGCSFVACRDLLRAQFGADLAIYGVFAARRVVPC